MFLGKCVNFYGRLGRHMIRPSQPMAFSRALQVRNSVSWPVLWFQKMFMVSFYWWFLRSLQSRCFCFRCWTHHCIIMFNTFSASTHTLSICPNMKKGFVVVFGFPASIKQPIDVQIFAVGHVPLFKLLLRSICLWIPSFEIRPFCCILMHFAYTCVFLAYCSFSRAARALPCGSGRLSIDKVPRRLQLLLQRWRMVTWWQFSAETSCFPEIASVLVQPRGCSMPDWDDSLVSSKVQFRECALRKTVHAIESRITTVAAGLWSLALELLQLLMEPKYRGCQSLLKLRLEPRCSCSGSCRSRRCASGTLDTAMIDSAATCDQIFDLNCLRTPFTLSNRMSCHVLSIKETQAQHQELRVHLAWAWCSVSGFLHCQAIW